MSKTVQLPDDTGPGPWLPDNGVQSGKTPDRPEDLGLVFDPEIGNYVTKAGQPAKDIEIDIQAMRTT